MSKVKSKLTIRRCLASYCRRSVNLNLDGICPRSRCVNIKANINKSNKVDSWPCTICRVNCGEANRSIVCDLFVNWTHATSYDMNEKEYETIQKFPQLNWYCSEKCSSKMRDAVDNRHRLEAGYIQHSS